VSETMSDDPTPKDIASPDDSLAFFGAITASVSHELNNVLAIMDQTTGLLEDRLSGEQEEIEIPAEKLEKIVLSLQKQAVRGLGIIKRLNRFAHSADYERQKFNVAETLQNLIQLIERLTTIKGVELEAMLPDEVIEVESNPFYLQQAVFTAFKIIMANAEKGDTLKIGLSGGDEENEIRINGPGASSAITDSDASKLKNIMVRLSGDCRLETEDQRMVIRLLLPRELDRQ